VKTQRKSTLFSILYCFLLYLLEKFHNFLLIFSLKFLENREAVVGIGAGVIEADPGGNIFLEFLLKNIIQAY